MVNNLIVHSDNFGKTTVYINDRDSSNWIRGSFIGLIHVFLFACTACKLTWIRQQVRMGIMIIMSNLLIRNETVEARLITVRGFLCKHGAVLYPAFLYHHFQLDSLQPATDSLVSLLEHLVAQVIASFSALLSRPQVFSYLRLWPFDSNPIINTGRSGLSFCVCIFSKKLVLCNLGFSIIWITF